MSIRTLIVIVSLLIQSLPAFATIRYVTESGSGAADGTSWANAYADSSLQTAINALQQIYEVGKYASKYIKATKCCLSLLGICDDFMAEPFHRFLAPERERVRMILESLR